MSRQHLSTQQSDDLGMAHYPQAQLQGHRSRSVPSVAAAADPYSSHASLYGPQARDGTLSHGFDPDPYYGEKSFSTFRYLHLGWSKGMNTSYIENLVFNLRSASTKPCYANGRCQSRQKSTLMRQVSAGSLPQESRQRGNCLTDPSGWGNSSYALQHPSDDPGYKSDGEGYKSDGGGCYQGCTDSQHLRHQHTPFQNHHCPPQGKATFFLLYFNSSYYFFFPVQTATTLMGFLVVGQAAPVTAT